MTAGLYEEASQLLDQAKIVACESQEDESKALSLSIVSGMYLKLGDTVNAISLLHEVLDIIKLITNRNTRDIAFSESAIRLADTRQFTLAFATAAKIADECNLACTLAEIAGRISKAGQLISQQDRDELSIIVQKHYPFKSLWKKRIE